MLEEKKMAEGTHKVSLGNGLFVKDEVNGKEIVKFGGWPGRVDELVDIADTLRHRIWDGFTAITCHNREEGETSFGIQDNVEGVPFQVRVKYAENVYSNTIITVDVNGCEILNVHDPDDFEIDGLEIMRSMITYSQYSVDQLKKKIRTAYELTVLGLLNEDPEIVAYKGPFLDEVYDYFKENLHDLNYVACKNVHIVKENGSIIVRSED